MKIFAISDTHGNLDGLDQSGYDVVVLAGDLAPLRGWNERALVDQVRWMNTVFRDWCGRETMGTGPCVNRELSSFMGNPVTYPIQMRGLSPGLTVPLECRG